MNGYYDTAEAARIAHVPKSTVYYWAKTDLIPPSVSVQRPRLYSFVDLRDLVVAQKLRVQGAPVRDIRAALSFVRNFNDVRRLALANFAVHDGELAHPTSEGPVRPHRGGQHYFTVDMREVFETLGANADVRSLRPHDRIEIDPRVRGGTPVISGTRVPARLVKELAADGLSDDEIIDLYPTLTADDIRAAEDWEAA